MGLVDLLNAHIAKDKSTEIATLAAELKSEWNLPRFGKLLDCLAKEKCYTELLLLFLAVNEKIPSDNPLILEKSVVDAMFRGLGQLSRKSQPFAFLNNLSTRFIQGWEPKDPASKAELCLLFLAARRGGDFILPVEIFSGKLPMNGQ